MRAVELDAPHAVAVMLPSVRTITYPGAPFVWLERAPTTLVLGRAQSGTTKDAFAEP